MGRTVQGGSAASRILLLLVERHPVTLDQVARALRLRLDVVKREARRLVAQGLVVLEPLGDDVYVALTGAGITHLNLPAADVERLRARRPRAAPPRDESDPAFG